MTDFTKEIAATLAASRLQAPGGAVARGVQTMRGPSKGPKVSLGIDLSQDKEKFSLETSLKMAEVWRNLPQAVKEQGIGNPLLQEHLQKVQKLHPYLVADASIPGVLTPEGDARWSGKLAFATRPKSAQEMLEKKEADDIRKGILSRTERMADATVAEAEADVGLTKGRTAAITQDTAQKGRLFPDELKTSEEKLKYLQAQVLALKQGTKFEKELHPGVKAAQAKGLELTDVDIKLKTAQAGWYDKRFDNELAKIRATAQAKDTPSPYKGLFTNRRKTGKSLIDLYKFTIKSQGAEFAIQGAQDTLSMINSMGITGREIEIDGQKQYIALPDVITEPEALMWTSRALNELFDAFQQNMGNKDKLGQLQEMYKLATDLYVKAYQPLETPLAKEYYPGLGSIYIDPRIIDKLGLMQYMIEGYTLDLNDPAVKEKRKKDRQRLQSSYPIPEPGKGFFSFLSTAKDFIAGGFEEEESIDPYATLREED